MGIYQNFWKCMNVRSFYLLLVSKLFVLWEGAHYFQALGYILVQKRRKMERPRYDMLSFQLNLQEDCVTCPDKVENAHHSDVPHGDDAGEFG
jgi:hypothetical protein